MTDNVKLDLYNAVKSALIDSGDFKHVRKYNSQDLNRDSIISENYPIAYLHFSSVEWSPSKLKPDNINSTKEQNGNIEFTIYVATYSLKRDDETFTFDLVLINKVYRTLANLGGENFTPLQRIGEVDDVDNNNIRIWLITFSTMAIEAGIEAGKVDVSPATLEITKEIL